MRVTRLSSRVYTMLAYLCLLTFNQFGLKELVVKHRMLPVCKSWLKSIECPFERARLNCSFSLELLQTVSPYGLPNCGVCVVYNVVPRCDRCAELSGRTSLAPRGSIIGGQNKWDKHIIHTNHDPRFREKITATSILLPTPFPASSSSVDRVVAAVASTEADVGEGSADDPEEIRGVWSPPKDCDWGLMR